MNTWAAINGMGTPWDKQFHIFLAILIIANYLVFRRYRNLKRGSLNLVIKTFKLNKKNETLISCASNSY